MTTDGNITTLTGLAVTLVALSRFIASSNPKLAPFLGQSLEAAKLAGVKPEDLELLHTIVRSITPI